MLNVVTWLWGDKYNTDDVVKLRAGVSRHLSQPHKFMLVTDSLNRVPYGCSALEIPNLELTKIPGCYARLVMFSPQWQRKLWLAEGDKIVCMDLDTVITGPLDPLFDRPEPFVILHGGNFANPCKFGGALMMLRPGAHPEIWSDFSVEAASKVPFYQFPDDQGWIWHKVPDAAGWQVGKPTVGVYVFRKPGWSNNDELPKDARLVTFNGWRSPQKFNHLSWVKEHWVNP